LTWALKCPRRAGGWGRGHFSAHVGAFWARRPGKTDVMHDAAGQRGYPWWRWATFFASFLFLLPLACVSLLGMQHVGVLRRWWGPLSVTTVAVFTVWGCWVCPVLEAGRPDLRRIARPANLARFIRFVIWSPALAPFLAAAAGLPIAFVAYGGHLSRIDWVVPTWLIAAWPVSVVVCAIVDRWAMRTLRRALTERRMCLGCGYDLRATAGDACPECGRAVDI
jgi:hypothetical protein